MIHTSQHEVLSSKSNPWIKAIRRALDRSELLDGACVVEGVHLVEEAARSGCRMHAVLHTGDVAVTVEAARVVEISPQLMQSLVTTETHQGLVALVEAPTRTLVDVFAGDGPVVVLDGIQDPGNAGAVVRSAEAFQAAGVVWLDGTVSPFNPKSVRASAGSLFRVPYVRTTTAEAIAAIEQDGRKLFSAMPGEGARLHASDLRGRCAIAFGNEGQGVRPALHARSAPLCIEAYGVESLNASVAAGVILYEAWRQRNAR